ncbi:uncharacterized protein FFFS_15995 [Fusarium fujikuroi]|nr:uncharacterized protein FFFS_15995 [Fusarium fujikuroi]
MSENFYSYN